MDSSASSSSSSSSSSTSIRHIRSISLPSRSHPSTFQVEEELTYLKTWEASLSSMATADTVCGALVRLERLYTCVNDLLCLPLTQQALSHRKHDKLVDELLDQSMRLLDVCGTVTDAIEQAKEHARDAQSALRRKKGDLDIDASLFKKMRKDAKRTISALKQIDNKIGGTALLDLDHHLSAVIRSLRDTSAVSISVFGSLLLLESIFVSKPKSTRWSIVSNLIHKGKTASADQPQISNEALECHIEVIENSLKCTFRSLIKTRTSLLNIRSH